MRATLACAGVVAGAIAATATPVVAMAGSSRAAAVAEVWIRGDEGAVPRVREVVDELLGRAGVVASWHTEGPFRPEAMLDELSSTSAEERIAARIWIDLGVPDAAGVYIGDGARQRFVVRRIALPRGLDEIAREEIGRIVSTATSALMQAQSTRSRTTAGAEAPVPTSDDPATLSRAEARAALESLAAIPLPPPPSSASDGAVDAHGLARRREPAVAERGVAFELGAVAGAEVYARDPTAVGRVGVTAALARIEPGAGLIAWTELDTTLPASHSGATVHIGLRTDSWRAGLGREWGARAPDGGAGGGRWAWRLTVGAGVDHVTFTPGSDTAAATPAPGAAFWTAAARVGVETELRSWRALRVLLGLSCDVILADVHYDVRDDAGHMRRYFVPFAVRPALSVGLAWRF